MDRRNDFRVDELIRLVERQRGPVLVFDCANSRTMAICRQKLLRRSTVVSRFPQDETDLWATLCHAREQHLRGEPQLPRKLVAAVLIVRKLMAGDYWGGENHKNFLYSDELAKGRGVDETFRDIAPEVASILSQYSLLQTKYGGGRSGRQKYALNPEYRGILHSIANNATFPEPLERLFFKDRVLVSALVLDR